MACESCRAPKDIQGCESCGMRVCKNCVEYLTPERLEFLPEPKPDLVQIYCISCFERDAAALVARYDEAVEQAKEVITVAKNFKGPVDIVKKASTKTEVKGHPDRSDAIRHLSFLAAWGGYNAILEMEVGDTKQRNHGYETHRCHASGWFAKINPPSEESR